MHSSSRGRSGKSYRSNKTSNQTANTRKRGSGTLPAYSTVSVLGFNVRFPFQSPYGAQLALMSSLLKTLDRTVPGTASHQVVAALPPGRSSHAILEAPTGTGKTLALLTAALEWQGCIRRAGGLQRLSETRAAIPAPQYAQVDMPTAVTPSVKVEDPHEDEILIEECSSPSQREVEAAEPSEVPSNLINEEKVADENNDDDYDDDFQTVPFQVPRAPQKKATLAPSETRSSQLRSRLNKFEGVEKRKREQSEAPADSERKKRKAAHVPKIYYATRTHSQVKKAVSELEKTAYRPTMCVLASRDHLCVHPQVSALSGGSKEQQCKALIGSEPIMCEYYRNVDELADSPKLIPPGGELQVWDIEDLVDLGKSMTACPFFASRLVEHKAELIFSPYNYLIEPSIREAMGINLDDAIVIFDEAHNIEDCARSAASLEFDLADLGAAVRELQIVASSADIMQFLAKANPESTQAAGFVRTPAPRDLDKMVSWLSPVREVLASFEMWLSKASLSSLQETEFERLSNSWGSQALFSLLKKVNITPANIGYLRDCLKHGMDEYDLHFESSAGSAGVLFSQKTIHLVESLLRVFEFALMEEAKFIGAYCLLMEKAPNTAGSSSQLLGTDSRWTTKVCILCLHAAVGFSPIVSSARSIILVSGTVAPFDGLRMELGLDMDFKDRVPVISLSTGHVLQSEAQLVALRICRASGFPLRVDYQTQDRADFQDGVGETLLTLIGVIPDGVLVFLPSYAMLDKLAKRWKNTGLWNKLSSVKPIFVEPKSGLNAGGEDLASVFGGYEKAIKQKRGAIFLAVCRGKLSEGIDFQNQFARAVVVIGIPFAHVKSRAVQLKKDYNSTMSKLDSRFLSGSAWYTLQAFRALNQSVGRVVRHSKDYGAIILIDERFEQQQSEAQLSSWVRRALKAPVDTATASKLLRDFFPLAASAAAAKLQTQ